MEGDRPKIQYFPNIRKELRELSQELAQAEADDALLDENYPRLQEQYPHCWIAVYQGKLVATSKRSQSSLIKALRKKGLTQEQIAQVRVRYILSKGEKRPRILLNAA